MSYTCPICGYDQMPWPVDEGNICPCCGNEFGYDDYEMSHAELRAKWIAEGLPWFSSAHPSPTHWDARAQIAKAFPDESTHASPDA
jgi:hypothetical protein